MSATATRLLDNYVGGRWMPAQAATRRPRRDQPRHRRGARARPALGRADLDAAVAAARAALPEWREVAGDRAGAPAVRAARAARRAPRGAGALGHPGHGQDDRRRPRRGGADDRDGRGACAIPTTMQGQILEDVSRGVDVEMVRQPVGVCAAIIPFNFPAMVPFWFLPFAIACGNTFVLKPSEQVPLTQRIAFELIDELGSARRRRQPRQRRPRDRRGDARPPRDRRDLLRRLGAGRAASSTRARPRAGKRVQALGGAKNHMVVMPDAVIDRTVAGSSARPSAPPASAAWRARCWSSSATPQDAAAGTAGRGDAARSPSATGCRATDVGPLVSADARDRVAAGSSAASAKVPRSVLDGRGVAGRDPAAPSSARRSSTASPRRWRRPRGGLRPGPHRRSAPRPRPGDRARQHQPLRQRHLDLHRVRRRRPRATATRSRPG